MYVETWYKTWCPKCNAVNWVCEVNLGDPSVADVEGILCHKCSLEYLLLDDGDDELELGFVYAPYCKQGLEKPQ